MTFFKFLNIKILLLVLLYFIFHTIYGAHGAIAYFKLNEQLQSITDNINAIILKRVELEHYIKLLHARDKDFIDEKTRKVLGVASPKEQLFSTTQAVEYKQ